MDKAPQLFTKFASNAPKNPSDAPRDYSGLSSSISSRSKRKWGINDGSMNLQDDTSLFLGLAYSSNSCVTTTSMKEVEEESSIDLALSIKLPQGNKITDFPKNKSCSTPKSALEPQKPNLVLELSLSTTPAESDVTTVTQGFTTSVSNAETPIITSPVQLVDEGSTSSRWKLGPLVPPFLRIPLNLPPPTTDMPKDPVACSSGMVSQQNRRSASVKTCQFNGCVRGARGASGLCIAHGGGRRCQKDGCQKGAEGRTVFCKAHGGGRRCQHLGCTKSAEGRTDYCIGHGGGRRCGHEGCTRASRGKSGLCIRHGGGKRCTKENCTKSAEGVSGLCISHGGGRRCQYPACAKGAQGSTKFCKAHGGGRRCTAVGCTKGAEGSTPFCKGHGGGKRCTFEKGCTKSVHGGTLFCVSHGGGKRCAATGCTKSARGRTDFCVRHGGGKRCHFDGCGKSAQGSTDFCKAHGGGKRCGWGQGGVSCDKFARGKSGLCASHGAQVRNEQSDGEGTSSAVLQLSSMTNLPQEVQFSLPEGRVHGGGLMAMLRGSASNIIGGGGLSEKGKSHQMPHSWV